MKNRAIILICVLIFGCLLLGDLKSELIFKGEGLYTFYSDGKAVVASSENAKEVKTKLGNIDGESIRYKALTCSRKEIIKEFNADIVFTETVGDLIITYAYSKYLKNTIRIDGRLINLQIAEDNLGLTVGSPVIFGSF